MKMLTMSTSMMMKMNKPKSMQWQIAFLIIAFATYVAGIRNGGSGIGIDGGFAEDSHNGFSTSPTTTTTNTLSNFFPSEPLNQMPETQMSNAARQSFSGSQSNFDNSVSGFRPSQILDFTHSDATTNMIGKKYPPSYLESPTYQFKLEQAATQTLDKQFAFPNERQQVAQPQYQQQRQQQQQYPTTTSSSSSSLSPTILTTPIITYVDPYTNENHYHYKPQPESQLHQTNYHNADDGYQREAPQAYTVQSSLLVGHQQRPSSQGPGDGEEVYLKRPGYVFDERPPIYGGTHNQNPRPPPRPTSGFLPTPLPTRLPPTPAPVRNQKISYDSHDYPPPSYSQLQTSNFVQIPPKYDNGKPQVSHSPPTTLHKQRIDYTSAGGSGYKKPLTETTSASSIYESSYSPNYANNFGNYLQGSQQQQQQQYPGNYNRPSLPSQPSPAYHPLDGPYARPPQQHHNRPPPHPLQSPSASTNNNNYYQYQIGEIPPPSNYRPPYSSPQYVQQPSLQGEQPASGLATLASLFGSTEQYAPQFTSLFGGGGGGPSSSSSSSLSSANNPLGSLLGAFTGATAPTQSFYGGSNTPARRPLNTQLIRALENIARNDDLQCVPKVLCQMIAAQTQRGQLPSFITSPAITNFLAGFPAASPALIYGRAALLGISGGDRSCIRTYEQCPKNEFEILHYLNNHRGGFFKFFSEPEEQTTMQQSSIYGSNGGGSGGDSSSLFSILSALTGSPVQQPTTTPRPPRPTAAPTPDIASGIGNFFTRVLSEYLSGVEYQRRRRRRSSPSHRVRRSILPDDNDNDGRNYAAEIKTDIEQEMTADFHDEEDDLDTRDGIRFLDTDEEDVEHDDDVFSKGKDMIGVLHFPNEGDDNRDNEELKMEGRILHKDVHSQFFPETPETEKVKNVIFNFNREESHRKLRFPREEEQSKKTSMRFGKQLIQQEPIIYNGWRVLDINSLPEEEQSKRRGKRVVFRESEKLRDHDETYAYSEDEPDLVNDDRRRGKELVFRDSDNAMKNDQLNTFKEQPRELQSIYNKRKAKQIVFESSKTPNPLESHHSDSYTEQNDLPNAIYEDAPPPQRGARIIFPDHYERHIRKGRILNKPTYAPTYENYLRDYDNANDRFVVSDSHRTSKIQEESPNNNYEPSSSSRPSSSYYYSETTNSNYQTNNQNSFNYGEYMPPSKSTPAFLPTITPNRGQQLQQKPQRQHQHEYQQQQLHQQQQQQHQQQQHYNYPNTNYISSNRYSSKYQQTTRTPKYEEDDKNIYYNNAHGVTEYYITPDGRKVYL